MLIETRELTLANVGLGTLHETALMRIFATAQAHRLAKPGGTLRDIVDADGRRIHAAYYMTHVLVPAAYPLESLHVWDRVDVGVDIHAFGGTTLDSHYRLARHGELGHSTDFKRFPSMHANSLFVLNEPGCEAIAVPPRPDTMADLPRILLPPPSTERFRSLSTAGAPSVSGRGPLCSPAPMEYDVIAGRDAAPTHPMMFASFIDVMDASETLFLGRALERPFSSAVLHTRRLIERETYYVTNCMAGETIDVSFDGWLQELASGPPDSSHELGRLAAELALEITLRARGSGALLGVSRVRKRITARAGETAIAEELEQLIHRYGKHRHSFREASQSESELAPRRP